MENQKNKIQKFVNGLKATRMTDGQASFILSPDSVFGEYMTNNGPKGCKNYSEDCKNSVNSSCTNLAGFCGDSSNSIECKVNMATQDGCYNC